ncbi:MAG: hypothetical protein HC819_10820 [Cyclobacteriaceae bacterium]|nr:hypothetical protein [Cyclobacteriaceae bacterium]
MKIQLKANELVVKAGNSRLLNARAVDGKLIVTNQGLYFVAKAQVDQHYNMNVSPEEISELIPFNTWSIIPNGLSLVKKSGERLRFKVKNRRSWETLINKMY